MNTLNSLKIFEAFDELCVLLGTLKRTGNLSLIEKDLTLEKLRDMYGLLSGMETIDTGHTIENKTGIEIEKAEIIKDNGNKNTTEEIKGERSPAHENHYVEPVIFQEAEKDVIKGHEPEEKKKTGDTLGDKYQGSKKFMNEHISEHHPATDISVKQQLKPVEDIGKAIGLNDKFLFINELFKGDSMFYKQTVEKLNNAASVDEALSLLHENFNWDKNDENAKKFTDLVKRKFI